MLRVQRVVQFRAVAASAWAGLLLAACQGPDEYFRGTGPDMGQAGTSASGAAGSIAVSGAAGTTVSGTAGTFVVSGVAGNTAGGGGVGGTTGAAGITGTAGATGAAGRGGTTGAGGAAGRAGQGGATGSAGQGGTVGTAGAGGRAGAGGAAGRGGTGGTSGAAGMAGTTGRGGATGAAGSTGSGGANGCPLGGKLDCTSAGSLKLTPDGQVVDFSAAEWTATTQKWCDADGLDGGLFSFAGTSSTAAAAVDATAQNLRLDLTVGPGQYAGGGVKFDSCVDARGFNSLEFTATLATGSLTGCAWQVQLQTQDQVSSTATNPTGGTCNASTTTCSRYPAATLAAATATATTFMVRFTAFNNPASSAIATAGQIAGVQWQVNSGNNGAGTCTVGLRIDNVRFVTQ